MTRKVSRRTRPPQSLKELGERIAQRILVTASGCHEWRGARDAKGYGKIGFNGRVIGTHRAMMAVANDDLSLLDRITACPAFNPVWVLHRCDNPPCCNPAHLRMGNANDNSEDKRLRHPRYRNCQRGGVRAISSDLPARCVPSPLKRGHAAKGETA